MKGEVLKGEMKAEVLRPDNYKSIMPEEGTTLKEATEYFKDLFDNILDVAEGIGKAVEERLEKQDYFTTSEERIGFAKYSKGEWEGEPGNSKFYPENQEARDVLKEYGQDGIVYKDGNPDFSKVSKISVEIDDMTSSRPDNYRQANEACAKIWNELSMDGRNNWTAREVDNWRKDNNYSWNERIDRKTMDLVPRPPHEECKHYGGVAECKRAEAYEAFGGEYDE